MGISLVSWRVDLMSCDSSRHGRIGLEPSGGRIHGVREYIICRPTLGERWCGSPSKLGATGLDEYRLRSLGRVPFQSSFFKVAPQKAIVMHASVRSVSSCR